MSHKIGVIIPASLRAELFRDDDIERLCALAETLFVDAEEKTTEEETLALLADCTIALGSWKTPYPSQSLLDACPRLELWEHAAGSVRKMFGEHMDGRDLKIGSCRMAIADTVAELTIAWLVIGLRRAHENAEANRKGRAKKTRKGMPLGGARVGLVGASEVGKRVIRLLEVFRARTTVYDPYLSDLEAEDLGVHVCRDLTELCAASDAITLHTPDLPSTERMMGAEQFAAMRDGGVFVNTARGACVDEDALIAELQSGRLYAFLDVTKPEPAADDSPLRTSPNCLLTSHLAGGRAFNIGAQAVDEIEAYIIGKPPIDLITADMLDGIA